MKILQIFVLIISLAVFTSAQTVSLTGHIYDSNGAVIPGSKVTAKDKSGKTYSAIPSNDEGVFTLLVPKGVYSLEFSANCSKTFKLENYRIVKIDSDRMFLDVSLEVDCVASDGEGFF